MNAYPFCASPAVPAEPTRPGWRWHRLTDLARLATGHTPSRGHSKYWGGDIPWIQLPDIRALDGQRAVETSECINALGVVHSAAVILPAGTVCLSRTASVGFVTIMGRAMATSQDFVNWVCGPDLDPEFLMHLLIACRKPIRDLGSGAVHHTIYFPAVESFSVCIPEIKEQRHIVAGLSPSLKNAEVIAVTGRERLAATQSLPDAYLREIFEGLEATEWETVPLGEVCRPVEGQVDPRDPEYRDLPHINGETIESGTGRLLNIRSASEDGLISGKYLFEPGMVLYSKLRPYLRKVAIAPTRGLCSADMYPLMFDQERVDTAFAKFTLLAAPFTTYAVGESRRARMPKLNRDQLFAWKMPLPELGDQCHIAARLSNHLSATESVVSLCHAELNAIESLPAALLRAAFNGDS